MSYRCYHKYTNAILGYLDFEIDLVLICFVQGNHLEQCQCWRIQIMPDACLPEMLKEPSGQDCLCSQGCWCELDALLHQVHDQNFGTAIMGQNLVFLLIVHQIQFCA